MMGREIGKSIIKTSVRSINMLRSFLIYLSKAAWARSMVTNLAFARRAASRFVAGEKLEDAILAVKALNQKGINVTLDHLGEHTTNSEESKTATEAIIQILRAIAQSEVRSNISIKLTQIGLALGEELCAENLALITECARDTGNFVRIDMEDAPWVDATLRLFRRMHFERGFENVGVVIQAYLYRSEKDIDQLVGEECHVRLCKGAYKEPAEIAYPNKSDVDASFDRLAQKLLDGAKASGSHKLSVDGKIPPIPALATHDPERIDKVKTYSNKIGLSKEAIEFQMLYGIRRDLQ
jgi:proline dehydrogenase